MLKVSFVGIIILSFWYSLM